MMLDGGGHYLPGFVHSNVKGWGIVITETAHNH